MARLFCQKAAVNCKHTVLQLWVSQPEMTANGHLIRKQPQLCCLQLPDDSAAQIYTKCQGATGKLPGFLVGQSDGHLWVFKKSGMQSSISVRWNCTVTINVIEVFESKLPNSQLKLTLRVLCQMCRSADFSDVQTVHKFTG